MAYVQAKRGDHQNASRWAQLAIQSPADRTRVSFRSAKARSGPKDILAVLHGRAKEGCIKVHRMHVAKVGWESPQIEWVMANGGYETAEYQALKTLLRLSDRVLELGAGVGFLAAYCAERLGDDTKVLAVEADPSMHESICATFEANGVKPGLVMAAVSATGEPRVLQSASDFWSTKTASPGQGLGTLVDGVALSALVARHKPTVIICDIEGGETDLAGADLPGVRAVLIEVHSDQAEIAVESWLTPQGFQRRDVARRIRIYERNSHAT